MDTGQIRMVVYVVLATHWIGSTLVLAVWGRWERVKGCASAAEEPSTRLEEAVQAGDVARVRQLIEEGADWPYLALWVGNGDFLVRH